MGAGHERYEELAVGHVLGGLDPVDAADFRSHLVTCRDCRLRVAELRDLASDLAAAEREERTAAQVKTEVVRRDAPPEPEKTSAWNLTPRFLVIAGALVLAVFIALAFWNAHLRESRRQLLAASERREVTLATLAEADPVAAKFAPGVSGMVAADRNRVALTVGGVPTVPAEEVVAVWLRSDAAPADVAAAGAESAETSSGAPASGASGAEASGPSTDEVQPASEGGSRVELLGRFRGRDLPEQRLALADERGNADELIVTMQRATPLTAPAGRELVSASLDGAVASGAQQGSGTAGG